MFFAFISVMADGWTDISNTSLVNIAIFADIPIFIQSLDPAAQRHDSEINTSCILYRHRLTVQNLVRL